MVLEVLTEADRPDAEVARAYDVHPVTVSRWNELFLEQATEVFGGNEEVRGYEKRMSRLEWMLGQKEVQIALPKDFLDES